MSRTLLAALVFAAACQSPTPEPEPPPDPVGPGVQAPHPCDVLGVDGVAEVFGEQVEEVDATGGQVLQLCTYELPDGLGSVDLAIVNLHALAAQGEIVTPNAYIAQLRDGAGQGHVEPLPAVGEGDAITIAYQFGSQAWAWEGMLVVGAYTTNVLDPTAAAVRLLEAALEAL